MRLLNSNRRGYVTWKELRDLQARFSKMADRGPREALTATNHLELLAHLLKKFSGQVKINTPTLITATDTFLREQGYLYTTKRRRVVSGCQLNLASKTKSYDLAFYSPLGSELGANRGHHNENSQNSIFYFRTETWGRTALLGNLQIDAPPASQHYSTKLNILLRRKNLYTVMVQEALKHAVSSGKERIIFQAGSAVAWAQWQSKIVLRKTVITPTNYPVFAQHYKENCAQLEKLSLGIIPAPQSPREKKFHEKYLRRASGSSMIVYDKQPGKISARRIFTAPLAGSLHYAIHGCYMHRIKHSATRTPIMAEFSKAHKEWETISVAVRQAQPEKIVDAMENILGIIDPGHQVTRREEKITYLSGLNFAEIVTAASRRLAWNTHLVWLEKYLEKFNHAKVLLQHFPEIQVIDFTEAQAGRHRFYLSPIDGAYFYLDQKDFFQPKLGARYLEGVQYFRGGQASPLSVKNYNVYLWYEKTLPKILTSLGLAIEKVTLFNINAKHPLEGWEIKSGLPEFASRPIKVF